MKPYEPPAEIERKADAAVEQLRERGSPWTTAWRRGS